jgi:hypothetical protein
MVVDWIEASAERGEEVTRETIVEAVQRNSMNQSEQLALHREVYLVLRRRGYDLPDMPLNYPALALAGAACAVFWVLAIWAFLHYVV